MKQQLKRILSLSLLMVMALNIIGPMLGDALSDALAARAWAEIPEAVSLSASETGDESAEGEWRYALRESDGYAVITGYDGPGGDVTIPTELGGAYVVGIADGALADVSLQSVKIHGNILLIGEDAFGVQKPLVRALNGSYALYYADRHGLEYTTGRDYTLVPGVVDFTDSEAGSLQPCGDNYVWIAEPEAMRLREGSVFYFEDARGLIFYYRVVALTPENGGMLAAVEDVELCEAIIEAHIRDTYYFTADDFIPAAGVQVRQGAGSRAAAMDSAQDTVSIDFVDLKIPGQNDTSAGLKGNHTTTTSTSYVVDIVNGEVLYMSTEETVVNDTTATFSYGVEVSDKPISEPLNFEKVLGKFKILCSIFSLDFKVKIGASITGSCTVSYKSTSVQKKHYDFDIEDWVLDYENSHASRDSDSITVSAKLQGKVYVKGTITLEVAALVSVLQIEVEVGLKISYGATIFTTDLTEEPCMEIKIALYLTITIRGGVWVQKDWEVVKVDFGAKGEIYKKEYTHYDWFGEDEMVFHVWTKDPPIHEEKDCPYRNRHKVEFDTRTAQLIDPCYVYNEESVPFKPEYQLEDSKEHGTFLGWADSPTESAPNWEFDNPNYIVTEDMTLYAVWENRTTVHFDSRGGTPVPDQSVPVGGYAAAPDPISLNGKIFMYWYTLDDEGQPDPWDFGLDTVPVEGVTLYARWMGEDFVQEGTTQPMYIGNIGSLDLEGYGEGVWSEKYVSWNFVTDPDGNILGVAITGLKNDPANLIVRSTLEVTTGTDSLGIPIKKTYPVVNIYTAAFSGYDSLRSVRFEHKIGLDTQNMFRGSVNLQFVDLTSTWMSTVQPNAFNGCTSLECAALPAGISVIENSAFENCEALTEAELLLGVTEVGSYAFSGCKAIEDVSLPESITDIGEGAFNGCSSLTELYIPDSTQNISQSGVSIIKGCTGLTELSIGGVETVQMGTFFIDHQVDNLKQITVRKTVDRIGNYGFSNNSYVEKTMQSETAELYIEIEEGVESIGEGAFYYMTAITGVKLPQSLVTIGRNAFKLCNRMKTIDIGGTVYIGPNAFQSCTELETWIPSGKLRVIDDGAFQDCVSLPYMYLPQGVEVIGQYVFNGCTAMEDIVIPDSVREVSIKGTSIIGNCTSLKNITIGGPETIETGVFNVDVNTSSHPEDHLEQIIIRGSVNTIGAYAFSNTSYSSMAIDSDTAQLKIHVMEGVETVGAYAFYNCSAITEVVLPDSVTAIANNAFESCDRMETIEMGNPTVIGNNAFENCTALEETDLRWSTDLREIGASAFLNCTSLTEMILPEGVETIGKYAFEGCSGIEKLHIPDSVKSVSASGSSIIKNCTSLKDIYIGGPETVENGVYKIGSTVPDSLEYLTIGGSVKNIGANAFKEALKSTTAKITVIVMDGVKTIGGYAFYYDTGVKEVYLPDSMQTIGEYAFKSCSRMTDLETGGTQSIGASAFASCTMLENVTFNDGLRELNESAFSGCTKLKAALLKEGLQSVAAYVFSGCTNLEELEIPSTVRSFPSSGSIMQNCSNLGRLVVGAPANLTTGVFRASTATKDKLQEVVIGGGVKSVGSYAFSSSSSSSYALRSTTANARLVIEEGVESLEKNAFYNCTAFTEIVLPESLTTIGDQAFRGLTRTTALYMGGNVTSIGSNAFQNCTNLTVYLSGENAYVQSQLDAAGIAYEIDNAPEYTLTCNANGGSFPGGDAAKTLTAAWRSKIPELSVPVNGSKVFCGWYTDEACTQPWILTAMPARDMTLYAGWDIEVYSLALKAQGGMLPCAAAQSVPAGSRPVQDVVPTRTGCSFTGWYLDSACTREFSGVMPAESLTLYAGWAAVSGNADYTFADGEATLILYQRTDGERTEVYLPERVNGMPLTGIAANAFYGQEITELHLPASLERMDDEALCGMDFLKRIEADAANTAYASRNGVLYSKDSTVLVRFPALKGDWYTVPNSVAEIAAYAFEGAPVEQVHFGANLRSIGERAFASSGLADFEAPGALESIGDCAFYDCANLGSVIVGSSVTAIGENAFEGAGETIMMYGPVEDCAIRRYAEQYGHMYNYYKLTLEYGSRTGNRLMQAGQEMSLPTAPDMGENKVFTGWYTDEDCTIPWENAVMPAGALTLYAGSIEEYAYSTGTSLTLTAYQSEENTATVPEAIGGTAVTAIGAGCFGEGMTRIVIPACVTTIEDGAIPASAGLTIVCSAGSAAETYALAKGISVERPVRVLTFVSNGGAQVKDIEAAEGSAVTLPAPMRTGYTFAGWCTDAELTAAPIRGNYTVTANQALYAAWTLADEAAANLSFTWKQEDDHIIVTGAAEGAENVVIPASLNGLPVTAIEKYAFFGNAEITSVTIPGTIVSVSGMAFANCAKLESVTLCEGVKKLEAYAFSGCTRLTQLSLPASLERMESCALAAAAVTELNLGKAFVWMASDALDGCDSLENIFVNSANAYYCSRDGVLYDTVENSIVKYPAGRTAESYTVTDSVNVIGAEAFRGANHLKEITLPDSIWSVGAYAFAGCTRLENMPALSSERLVRIPEGCFRGCRLLKEAAIPENVTAIESLAFDGCSNLKKATAPATVTKIGLMAFTTPNMQIHGAAGSEAEAFAKANDILFVSSGTVLPTSVSVSKTTLNLSRGGTAQLTASILPANATETGIRWSSADVNVATVSQDGAVRAISGGSTTIYAVTANGLYAACTVTVNAGTAVEQVLLSRTALTLKQGNTALLSCVVLPADAESVSITWASSNEAVASVNAQGMVTALSEGTAVITVTAAEGVSASCTVTVDPAGIEIIAPDRIISGTAAQLSAVDPATGEAVEGAVWSVDDSEIAEINADGLLTFKRAGFVTVTAANGSVRGKLFIECSARNTLYLPKSLKIVGEESFIGSNAEEIVLPAGARSIGAKAFADCAKLGKVRISANVTNIDDSAFSGSTDACIVAPAGSAAEAYAKAHGMRFVAAE